MSESPSSTSSRDSLGHAELLPAAPLPDSFSTIRRHCQRHLRRLERYRKARSFCSLAEDVQQQAECSGGHVQKEPEEKLAEQPRQSAETEATERQFADLREKMLLLVENDMALLAKLLSLGDTLHELRQRQALQQQCQQPGTCQDDAEDDEEEEEEEADQFRPLRSRHAPGAFGARQRRQRQPIPAEFGGRDVTRLYVRDERGEEEEDGGGEEEPEEEAIRPNVQYFSRKNSVLRIPIPPRASNRCFVRAKRVDGPGKESKSPAKTTPLATVVPCEEEEEQHQLDLDSGHSSASEHSPAASGSAETAQSRYSTLSSGLSLQSSLSGGGISTAAGKFAESRKVDVPRGH